MYRYTATGIIFSICPSRITLNCAKLRERAKNTKKKIEGKWWWRDEKRGTLWTNISFFSVDYYNKNERGNRNNLQCSLRKESNRSVCFIYKIILSAILCDIKFERRYFCNVLFFTFLSCFTAHSQHIYTHIMWKRFGDESTMRKDFSEAKKKVFFYCKMAIQH